MNAPVESFAATLAAAAVDGAPALRRAALMLHTLAPEDRAWLLERLPESRRASLVALTGELRQLDIPPAPELVDDLGAAGAKRVAAPVAAPAGLVSANAALVATVLAQEPAQLVARVVALGPWPWTGPMLALLGATQRRAVMDLLADNGARPASAATNKLDERLLELLEARVASLATAAPRVHDSAPAPRRAAPAGWTARVGALVQGLLR